MRRQAIPWATALFFIFLFSCDKDKTDPECKDASCCNPELNGYVGYITDMPAHLSGPPQFSNWGIRIPTGYPPGAKYTTRVLTICEKSMNRINGLPLNVVPVDSTKMSYPYLVSGKVLADVKGQWFLLTPVLYVYVDKIEKIKP